MKCRYIYKGQVFESEAALDDFLIEKRKYESKFGDLVFSRTSPFLSAKNIIENKIMSRSKELEALMKEARLRAGSFDGDEILEFRAPYIGVTKFLSGLMVEDKLLFPEFRLKSYWSLREESWTTPLESGEKLEDRFTKDEIDIFFEGETFEEKKSKIKLLNPTEVKQLQELMTNKWDFQAASGSAVHYILQKYFTKDPDTGKILGDSERNLIIDKISSNIEKDLREELGSRFRESICRPCNELVQAGYIDIKTPTLFGNLVGQLRFSNYLPEEEVGKHIMRLRQYYDVGFEEATYYVEDRVFYFNFLQDNRAIVRIFPMEDYCKIDPDIKMKEYRYGIIYIRETDEFQMQDIDSAFDYIPDETNDSVIYMREPIPIEIGVKPIKKELLSIEE